MPSSVLTTQHPVLTSNRTALAPAIHTKLLDLEVESTYNRHDICMVTFDIDAKTEIPPALELGKPFEVGFRGDSATTKIFEGEITALEFDSRDCIRDRLERDPFGLSNQHLAEARSNAELGILVEHVARHHAA